VSSELTLAGREKNSVSLVVFLVVNFRKFLKNRNVKARHELFITF